MNRIQNILSVNEAPTQEYKAMGQGGHDLGIGEVWAFEALSADDPQVE